MTDMTLGQRIAERRKLLGLSQEAFGDKMGVSRQAISKWEADAATPEIEKLITMSKLFGVSVGWLLGTEDDSSPKAENFTEAQIKAIEQIARQYRSEPTPRSHRNWPTILCAIGVALSLILSFSALNEASNAIEYSANRIDYLNNSIYNLQNQINDLKNQPKIESTGAELLMDWQLGIEAKSDLSGAYITFTGVPISTQSDDQAYISIRRDGQEVTTAVCSRDNSGYTATAELPIADGYVCYFMVTHSGGNSEQQRLVNAELEHLDYALRPHAASSCYNYSHSAKDRTFQIPFDKNSSLDLYAPDYLPTDAHVVWSDLALVMYHNGTAVDRVSLSNSHANGNVVELKPDAATFSLPTLVDDDQLLLHLEGKLTIDGVTSDFSSRILGWCMDQEYGLCEMIFTDKW